MTTTLVLIAYAGAAGYLAPAWLARARWTHRSPRLGVAAWAALASSTALAALLAVISIAAPAGVVGHGVADWWHRCLADLRHYYGDASLVLVAGAAIAAMLLIGRLVRTAINRVRAAAAERRRHHAGLALLAQPGPHDVAVIPHEVPAAYCVPGHPGRVVMTSGVFGALDEAQVDAVVAHERAHLAGRHAALVDYAAILRQALGPAAPVFSSAEAEIGVLVEMIADDAATRACPAVDVADALLRLVAAPAPSGTLGAGGMEVSRRISRLVGRPRPLGRSAAVAAVATVLLGLAAPLVAVVGPVTAAVVAASCAHPSAH